MIFTNVQCNWPISQIPECTCSISQNAPFRTEMCTFLFWMEHSGTWNRYILGFVKFVYNPWKKMSQYPSFSFPILCHAEMAFPSSVITSHSMVLWYVSLVWPSTDNSQGLEHIRCLRIFIAHNIDCNHFTLFMEIASRELCRLQQILYLIEYVHDDLISDLDQL